MPIYEYKCKSCGHKFDKLQKINDPAFSDSGSDSISINIIGQGNANDYFPIGMDLYVDADGFAVSDDCYYCDCYCYGNC